jgi:hypothetical protein
MDTKALKNSKTFSKERPNISNSLVPDKNIHYLHFLKFSAAHNPPTGRGSKAS